MTTDLVFTVLFALYLIALILVIMKTVRGYKKDHRRILEERGRENEITGQEAAALYEQMRASKSQVDPSRVGPPLVPIRIRPMVEPVHVVMLHKGSRYHLPSCGLVRANENVGRVMLLEVGSARQTGAIQCGRCRPDRLIQAEEVT